MSLNGFINNLFRHLLRKWSWTLLLLLGIGVKLLSLNPVWVEKYYANGLYPLIAKIQRFLFGWIPFSIGDLFYGFLGLIILVKTVQFFRSLFLKKVNKTYLLSGLKQFAFFFLFVYVFFNLLWGLNYNRQGIAHQLGLEVKKYSVADLDTLCMKLHERLNYYAVKVDTNQRMQLERKRTLFRQAAECYAYADDKYRFLQYTPRSIKPSIYSYVSHYIGFYGYYNPFSGEGQVQTLVPVFVQPYVACHEIAHQLGYAKENEANFVGFLACRESPSVDFRYSVYYDMYNYAIGEYFYKNTGCARELQRSLDTLVKNDYRRLRAYHLKKKNVLEPIMMKAYDRYLRMNNQPNGKETYNEVIAWLIAYYKKFGIDAL
jgi:Protein of unknown function (DUF3810)